MNRSYPSGSPVIPGLCGDCRHARGVPTDRGRLFLQCVRAATDPAYPRYPVLPVTRCAGHERRRPEMPERAPEPNG